MTNTLFNIVANFLLYVSRKTKLTYNEINIILYYMIIPFSWLCLLDGILGVYFLKMAFAIFMVGFFVGCRNFKDYSDELFKKSVSFLTYFNRFSSNYIASSVWICVALPIVIYAFLIYLMVK